MKSRKNLSRKDLHKNIRQRVQAVEQPVPDELDQAFLKALDRGEAPINKEYGSVFTGSRSRSPWFAAAAAVLLAVMVVFFFLVLQQSDPSSTYVVEAGEVEVQETYVEDEMASTIMINAKDPDITIIWVEKIKKENPDEKND